MKNILYTLTLALLLGACSTSTNDDPSHFGTWRVDTQTHATWQGTQNRPVASVAMAVASDTDTTAKPDTTYFYSNDKIQATLGEVSRSVYEGDMELDIHQDSADVPFLLNHYGDFVITNIDNAFTDVGYRGSLFNYVDNWFTLKIQVNFNCNGVQEDNNLQLAIVARQADSLTTPPDTLMYYDLDTQGMYSTAAYIKGCY